MKKTRSILATILAVAIITTGGSSVVNAASFGVDINQTCLNQHGGQYRAYLQYNNVLGWRCKNVIWGSDIKTVNIQMYYCDIYHYGTTATWTNYNDPYNWKCTS